MTTLTKLGCFERRLLKSECRIPAEPRNRTPDAARVRADCEGAGEDVSHESGPGKRALRHWLIARCVGLVALCCLECGDASAEAVDVAALPTPRMEGGKPLMQALRNRRTTREFSTAPLPRQIVADLLWASFGVNRPSEGRRTAPSAMNAQEIDVYVIMEEGLYLYTATAHELPKIGRADLRGTTSGQDFARQAPVTLVFVADYARMVKAKPEQKEFYSAIDAGYISQNVYLFCASEGLATVVHDLNRSPLAAAMKLRPEQHIVLAQAVGYPR
jgi:nitroreductase